MRAVKDTGWSVRYYLNRYAAAPRLAERLKSRRVKIAADNPTIKELVSAVEAEYAKGLMGRERKALAQAARKTLRYYGGGESRLFEELGAPSASGSSARRGWPPGVAGIDPEDLPMKDARGYAASRLGALGVLAERAAKEGLRITFSPAQHAPWPEGCSPAASRRLHFPGSTHGFSARFSRCKDGGYGLILDGFLNPSLYVHEASMLKVLLEDVSPEVFYAGVRIAPQDGLLLGPFAQGSGVLREFDALALGYYEELKEEFSPSSEKIGESWRAFSVRVGTTSLVAVAVEDSWYGESLGASVARLIDEGVKFKTVYFAGSAGALRYLAPYSLAHPSCYLSAAGERIDIKNEFSGEENPSCHAAAESPLTETRAFLRRAAKNAETVDVEGFALAEAARAKGLKLATAYLITDYPDPPPILSEHKLSQTRARLRYKGARAYAGRLRRRLEKHERTYRHPIERFLKTPLEKMSAPAVERDVSALGALTELEDAFFKRVRSSRLPVIFRTRIGRLAHLVRDGLALSPRQVERLKDWSSEENTLTPKGEDGLFGAKDYLFAGAGQNDEEALYGPIAVYLSSAAWGGAFATRASGANLLAREGFDPKRYDAKTDAGRLRRLFAEDAVLAGDFSKRLAALAVAGYRAGAKTRGADWARERMQKALALDDAGLWRVLDQDTDAYLEVKIPRAFSAEAIACVEIDEADRRELGRLAGEARASQLPLRPKGGCGP